MAPKRKDLRPVAGYFRVSKARDEMQAPEIYRGQLEDWARYKKQPLGDLFSDVDFSGRKGAKPRPGLQELIRRRSEFSAVVTPRLNRFGRSLRDLAELFDTFDSDGIGLVFLDVDVDTRSSTGRLVRNIMASLAEWEGDRLSETWKATHHHNAMNGRPHGGQVPFGYRHDKQAKTYVVEPDEARVVRTIYKRFLLGDSPRRISADLNRRGVRTTRDATWGPRTITLMVENPSYAGLRKLDDDLITATWKPLVKRDTWDAAQEVRQATRLPEGQAPRTGKGTYVLSGLIVCGVCGRNLHHVPQKPTNPAMYACPLSRAGNGTEPCRGGGIAASRAEEMVSEQFIERLSGPLAKKALKAPRSRFPSGSQEDDLGERLAAIDAKMERLVELSLAASSGPGAERAFRKQSAKLETERAQIEEQIAARRASGVTEVRRIEDLGRLRAIVGDLGNIWTHADLEQRKSMLRLAMERVVLVPRPKDNPRGKGQPRGRQVEVEWADWIA